ncbi:hypothetical protein DFQ09_1155 [Winogradskyella pacifica]|uniref:Uncharacterized protein n=1 Tax=Winogradskyella pacifica TaxID=664642 RepID=A0A3D9LMN6_9FLAO|nr:hypothetical protein [Winogradskyella pacifica]REE07637.1 hypothetical protein DFQ09_1155 [Winogradskyella pacifica]
MNIFKSLLETPENWLLGIVFGAVGYLTKTIVDNYLNKSKKRVELQELYWKEKIESAKKASEYYLYQIGFFSLTADKYEMIEEDRKGAEELVESTQELISSYQKRLIEFPHFEHYHINLFYDFNESKTKEIIKENYESIQNIHSVNFIETDDNAEFKRKFDVLKTNFGILKKNNRELISIYQNYLKIIRDDIKTLPYE